MRIRFTPVLNERIYCLYKERPWILLELLMLLKIWKWVLEFFCYVGGHSNPRCTSWCQVIWLRPYCTSHKMWSYDHMTAAWGQGVHPQIWGSADNGWAVDRDSADLDCAEHPARQLGQVSHCFHNPAASPLTRIFHVFSCCCHVLVGSQILDSLLDVKPFNFALVAQVAKCDRTTIWRYGAVGAPSDLGWHMLLSRNGRARDKHRPRTPPVPSILHKYLCHHAPWRLMWSVHSLNPCPPLDSPIRSAEWMQTNVRYGIRWTYTISMHFFRRCTCTTMAKIYSIALKQGLNLVSVSPPLCGLFAHPPWSSHNYLISLSIVASSGAFSSPWIHRGPSSPSSPQFLGLYASFLPAVLCFLRLANRFVCLEHNAPHGHVYLLQIPNMHLSPIPCCLCPNAFFQEDI